MFSGVLNRLRASANASIMYWYKSNVWSLKQSTKLQGLYQYDFNNGVYLYCDPQIHTGNDKERTLDWDLDSFSANRAEQKSMEFVRSFFESKPYTQHFFYQAINVQHMPKLFLRKYSTAAQLQPLPEIPYDRLRLENIIKNFEMSVDVKSQIMDYLKNIENKISKIGILQSEAHIEDFYQSIKSAIDEIRRAALAMNELAKPYDQSLANSLKELLLSWINPLQAELNKRMEMPVVDRDELDLKTKHLYAEQSFISRQAPLQQTLMQHLGGLKELLLVSGHPVPRCYISYAWPSEQHKAQGYWVQPFLFVLYDHLKAAGIRVVMDIRDNNPGDSIYQFMKQYHEGNYIILVGTESLLQKHYGKGAHAVQTELSIINNRFEQDQSQFGQSRIYPMLISGTIKSAYPEIYDKYRTVRDARDAGYVGTLKKLIDWIYEDSVKQRL